jgi:hypothetical protein
MTKTVRFLIRGVLILVVFHCLLDLLSRWIDSSEQETLRLV